MILIFSSAAPAFAFCFEAAGAEYDISPRLLWSIAKVESDFTPQAVNWNQNGTYDYGLMQINSGWAQRLGMGVWRSLGDPCTNIKTGAWILAKCVQRYGYTWEAVGCYNASNNEKRERYARRIYAVFKKYFRRR
ncbi:MAG: lytic transglycosylase domain-containing protein [Nitrospiraceae bacterium]|nr:lytic transglycosylase domain-containing protein [Nitrospiraceae bacterium]